MSDGRTIVLPVEAKERRDSRAQSISRFLSALDASKPWEVVVRRFKRSRSNQQNRYERGVVCSLLSKAIGYEPGEVHWYLCGEHFGWKQEACPKTPNNPRGIRDVPIRTTTTNEAGERDVLNKQDYWDFVAFAQRLGAENGVYIPDPDADWWAKVEDAKEEAA